jgi:D-glycero-D-manno-heptose 1,7-bisphosphate phosphatase
MAEITQAVILAGGQGTRLRPLTLTTPKPLIQVAGRPFAEHLVELLKKNGIKQIIFLTGYLGEQFPAHFGDGSKFGVTIRYSQSALEDDTGERLRKARNMLEKNFLLLYGDNYWPLDLDMLQAFHVRQNVPATVTVYRRSDPAKKNNMHVGESGLVEIYDKKRQTEGLTGVDIGFFILSRDVLDLLPQENVNFESTVMPKLISHKKLAGFVTDQPYWGLTDAERLPSVERALNAKRKVLFIDRDGTLNVKAPKADYIKTPDAFEFLPGAVDTLKKLFDAGYEFYMISNQSGIARGMMTESDLAAIHQKMLSELKDAGITISGIYYCPHGWDSACECRKPKPGMFYQAAREHDIDLSRAVFVGDDERDKEAGEAAGIKTILVPSNTGIAAALKSLL